MKNNIKWELNPEIVARHFLKNVSVPRRCWIPVSGEWAQARPLCEDRCSRLAGVREVVLVGCRGVGWK